MALTCSNYIYPLPTAVSRSSPDKRSNFVRGCAIQFAPQYLEFCERNGFDERRALHGMVLSHIVQDTAFPRDRKEEIIGKLVYDTNVEMDVIETAWSFEAGAFAASSLDDSDCSPGVAEDLVTILAGVNADLHGISPDSKKIDSLTVHPLVVGALDPHYRFLFDEIEVASYFILMGRGRIPRIVRALGFGH